MIFLLLVAAVVGVSVLGMYNGLIGKKNRIDNAFAAIDAFLKKRHDLIPNLVSTAQAYMKHEKDTLLGITEMRSRAVSGGLSPEQRVQVEGQISKALGSIMVAVENYPDLKANQNFVQLQGSLNEIEEQIAAARRAFNAAVTDYNNAVQMFPTSLFAGMLGYGPKEVFTASAEDRENPDVAQMFKG